MYVDKETLLSDAQALTATAPSENTMDMGNVTPKNEVGTGEPLALVIGVDVAADHTTGNETYQFQLVQSANADLSSPDVLLQTDTTFIAATTLVAGYQLVIPVPPGLITKRYLGAQYTLGGTTPTITVTAMIVPLKDVKSGILYAKGYTVS